MSELKNNKYGFYDGPDGVFYDAKHDQIFELEYEGCEIFRKSLMKTVGKFYRYRTRISTSKASVAMSGLDNCIRLGEL